MNKYVLAAFAGAAFLIAVCVAQLNHNVNLHKELEKTERALQLAKAEKQAILATLDEQRNIEAALRKARKSAEEEINAAQNLDDNNYFDALMRLLKTDFQPRAGGSCDSAGHSF